MDKKNEQLMWKYCTLMLKAMRLGNGLLNITSEEKMGTILQLQALIVLDEKSRLTVGELAKEIHSSSPGAVQLVQRLINAHLVKKVSDAKDKRITHIYLTKDGKASCRKLPSIWGKKLCDANIFDYFPENDFKTIVHILKKAVKKFEAKKNE